MLNRLQAIGSLFWLGLSVILCGGSGAIAQDAAWHIGKSSGEVWLIGSGLPQASLGPDMILKPGDTIRTGASGRVLMVRGQDSISISPNSVIGIPAEPSDGRSTTIIQRAGSILIELEKRTVKPFEVLTPYFAAALAKASQLRVAVNQNDGNVDVLRGQVEVVEFKSGLHAPLLPGQAARISPRGAGSLLLSGVAVLSPILKGQPRVSLVQLVPVPKDGLSVPTDVPKGQQVAVVPAMGAVDPLLAASAGPAGSAPKPSDTLDPTPIGDGSQASVVSVLVARDAVADRPQVDLASALSAAAALHAASEDNASRKSGWRPEFAGWSNGGVSQAVPRANRNAEMAFDLALSLAVGASVAIVVAISRRRRRAPAVASRARAHIRGFAHS